MRYLVLGALLALLLLFPALGTAALGLAVTVLSQSLLVAFGLGLAAGIRMRGRRWAR
ncbi:hypothetical protein ACWCQZ_45465 [Streptomyces sp. NPDC002285]